MSERIVEVRIEELALEGLSPLDRDRAAAAASRELERLLGANATWAGGSVTVVGVDAGEIARGGHGPAALGEGIASAVHGRIAR
jgi:hypothetical protein